MSTSPSASASRSWKGAAPAPPGADLPRWRREEPRPRQQRSRRGRFWLGLLFLAVLCGLITWLILWLRPSKGTAVLILTAGYEENLAVPHNVAGRDGAKALAEMVSGMETSGAVEGGRLHLPKPPRLLTDVKEWAAGLDTAREKTVLLFVALHGGADKDGAYLLPQDALSPGAVEQGDPRLRLTTILDRLAQLPRDRNIVLVLDATQAPANWRAGMLHNSFVRALDALEDRIAAMPNLVVLCASDAEQRSWVCDELRRTAFTHFLIEGLKGHADGAVDSVKDGKINVEELHHYVSQNVERWARSNRGALQTPVLRPRGPLGLARARKIELTVVPPRLAPPPAPTPVFNPPGLLTEHWQQYVKLAGETPSPAVYSPHLWRRYQDTLTRYEELLQAGAIDNAHALEIRLREYGDLIRRARTVSLGSVGNSLSMADVAGMENPVSPTTDRALDELWKAFPKEHGKKWAELLAAADGQPGGRTGLRLRLTERLLKRAADDPGQNLTTAYHLLRTLDDPLNPRPVEAHLLIMLHRDLPRKDPASAASPPLLPARLISLALHVRVRAERAAVGLTSADDQSVPADPYPYCAQVVPWIRNRIEEADRLRRLGQDLLFSTDKLKWKEAEELLGNADRQYRLAQDEAVRVRAALAVRDRVLAAVPRYADWLARQASGLQPAGLADGLLEQLERLCKDAHTLADRLEKAPALQAPPEETDAQYLDLAEQANAVRRGLDAIEARFRPYVEKLFATQDSPALWRSLDDLLTVPASDVKRRMELLVRKSQVSRKFFDATLHVKGGPPGVEARTVEEMGKKSAEVRGRLALALLGDRCFNELGREPNDTAEMVRKSLGPFRAGEAWWQSIDSAGEQIGRRWRLLPAEIAKRLPEKGLKAVGPQAIPNLETAARLTRLVDGPGSLFPVLLSRNPVAEYRDHLVRDLVLWQADRMLRDYWHEEDAIKVPYFRAAGRVFVGDARQLDPFGLRSERIRQVEQELAKDWNGRLFLDVGAKPLPPTPSPEGRGGEELTGSPSPFGGGGWGEGFPQGPSVLHMTGEEEFPLRYRLQVNGNLAGLAGHPVVWVDAGQALEMRVPAAGQRMALSVGERPEPLRCVVTSPLLRQAELKPPDVPKATESSVTVHGLYRGRHFSVSTRLLLHPLPDVTLSVLPPPLNASLAVRAPREVVQGTPPRGALAIVLDCSGSMAAVPGQPPESSKFAEAADAVRRVLRQLPQGLLVSVWVFGQAIDPGKTTNTPEETIQKLLEPVVWDPRDNERINEVMTRINACQPWNQSPIVRAMWRAAREDLRGADGPKTLLVITDGMDNRFAEDKLLNRDKKGIGPFLAANFRDIKIQIIGFKFAGGEKEKAMEQFQEIAQLPIKGEFATVEDVPNLVDRMMRSVVRRGLSYRVIREDDHPLADQPDPRDVSEGQANEQWLPGGLRPGTYTGLLDVRGALPARVQLDRGDLLLLEAVPSKAGALRLRRALWSETVLAAPVAVEQHGWRLAVLENRLVKERGLEMLLTLETRTTALPVLQQVKPALTWIDVTPAEGKAPFHRRWRYHYGYPAPAWSVESPLWPAVGDKALATPQVRVWWSETLPPSAMAVVERDVDFKRPGDLVDRTVRVGDGEVVIESVRVEQRRVETRQPTHAREGKFEVKSCLVVRVRHSPQNPVQVSVEGLEPAPAGEEHRYYGGAGKYTALFWSVTADQADLTLRRLKLVSLAALKREAVKGESVIEVKNLREPQKADFRPPEPVELTPDDRDQTPAAPGSGPKTTPLLLPAPPLPTTPVSLGSEAGPYLPPAPVALPTSRQPSGAASRPR